MALDTTRLGELAAGMMERLAEGYEDHDVTVGTVALIVEVNSGDWTAVTYRCSDPRAWVQRGLMEAGISAIMRTDSMDDDAE